MTANAATPPITELLRLWSHGNADAGTRLFPLLYADLHRQASAAMRRERPGHTLQSTALVHEAFVRLVGADHPEWESRKHFLAIASRVMRQVLVDHARKRRAGKRGAGLQPVSLDEGLIVSRSRDAGVLRLDDALTDLAKVDEAKCRLVELHFFAGLSLEETAAVMSLSLAKVKRDWSLARAWLHRHMRQERATGPNDVHD
jgi:RNA polymerase sigma factor (TIGR02999 family)